MSAKAPNIIAIIKRAPVKLISCSLFRIFLCKSIPYRTKTKRFFDE
jgi:hypothetical protein